MQITLNDIIIIEKEIIIINDNYFKTIKSFRPIQDADSDSLVFIVANSLHRDDLIKNTKAITIICDGLPQNADVYKNKCLILSENPKLLYARIVNKTLEKQIEWGIHPTAVIHPEAKIAQKVKIGPYVTIGNSIIGEGTIIHPNVSIYDNVRIGKNVIIDSGTVIGASGFGYVRDENNIPVSFPQLGGVVIGDNVEIGANVCIDRGALQDTIIGNNTKIDNFSQISHNDIVGENNYIIGSVLSGSVTVGNNCWIAPSRVMNKKHIGDNVTVGFGSNVINNLESNKTYLGNPAVEIDRYTKIQLLLKKLIKKK